MRELLSLMLAGVLVAPVLAQPPERGEKAERAERGISDDRETIEQLKAKLRLLESKLKELNASGEKKGVLVLEMVKEGEKKTERKDEKKNIEVEVKVKSEDDRKPESPRDENRRPMPMGGGFGGGPGGPPMGGGGFGSGSGLPGTRGFGPEFGGFGGVMTLTNMPGFDKLSDEEKKTFKLLIGKMMSASVGGGGGQRGPSEMKSGGVNPFNTTRPSPRDGDRKPNVEERLDRLERSIDEIRKAIKDR